MRALFLILTFAAANAWAQQTLKGRILDSESKSPIIGANIILLDSTALIGTTTDLDGYFAMKNVPLGRVVIKVTYIGYAPLVVPNIMVTAGKEVVLNLEMTEDLEKLDVVVITDSRSLEASQPNNQFAEVSARSFNLEDTKRYAGALGDPSRMAQNFAGVVAGNDSRNDIVVRGNSPTSLLWQLEGLNIPNPNHFGALNSTGGPVSMLNNNNLSKSDFLTGAFPAQYGNAVGGIFDLRLRNGNDEKYEFLGQIGFNGFEVGAEGPFSKKSKSSFIANYRYSTLAVFEKLNLNFGTGNAVPIYQDINFKANIFTGKRGRLVLFGLAGMSNVDFLGNKVDTTETNLYSNENENNFVKYATGIAGLSYEYNLSEKTFAKFTLGISATDERFEGDSISTITRQAFKKGEARFSTRKYSAVLTLNHKFNPKNSLTAGAYLDYLQADLFNKDYSDGGRFERIYADESRSSWLSQAYAQWKHRFSPRLSLTTGLHLQHYNLGSATGLGPRMGLRYWASQRNSFSLGYGLHYQAQSIYSYFVKTPTAQGMVQTNLNMGFSRSHHIVGGYEFFITENLRLKTEAYYQAISNVPVESRASSFSALNSGASFAPQREDSLVNKGTGRNMGVEITLERFFGKGFYLLTTVSLFDSRYKGSDGIERNTAFNMNRVVNLLAGKEWNLGKRGMVFMSNIRLSSIGGRFLTPVDFGASRLEGTTVYREELAFSQRQADYLRADIKIGIRKDYKRSSMEFSIDLQNVTNHKNVFQQRYNRRTGLIQTEYQQGFFPVPTFRWTF